jgi:hypothetical protein
MATALLDNHTPTGADGMTIQLSANTRVVAHASKDGKAGYITISRFNSSKQNWRNVHISKKSLEKLKENSQKFLQALASSENCQVPLTKRQHVKTTFLERNALASGSDTDVSPAKKRKTTLQYVSLLHPTSAKESIDEDTDINHVKTINLKPDEFAKFIENLEKLLRVTATPTEGKSAANQEGAKQEEEEEEEEEETPSIKATRWAMEEGGQWSDKIFLKSKDAVEDVCRFKAEHAEMCENLPDEVYLDRDFTPSYGLVNVPRPSKLRVVEYVVFRMLQVMVEQQDRPHSECPTEEELDVLSAKLKKTVIVQMVKDILAMLKFRSLHFVDELCDLFFYVGGLKRVYKPLTEGLIYPSDELYLRLLHTCYDKAC